MADIILTQAEAEALIAMEKHRSDDERYRFPMRVESLSVPLQSPDRRESFWLDLSRGRINLKKVTMQNRGRQVVALVRLDLGGPPHRNPDDKEIPARTCICIARPTATNGLFRFRPRSSEILRISGRHFRIFYAIVILRKCRTLSGNYSHDRRHSEAAE